MTHRRAIAAAGLLALSVPLVAWAQSEVPMVSGADGTVMSSVALMAATVVGFVQWFKHRQEQQDKSERESRQARKIQDAVTAEVDRRLAARDLAYAQGLNRERDEEAARIREAVKPLSDSVAELRGELRRLGSDLQDKERRLVSIEAQHATLRQLAESITRTEAMVSKIAAGANNG